MSYVPRLQAKYKDEVVAKLQEEFNYTNPMLVPQLSKVVVNVSMKDAIQNVNLKSIFLLGRLVIPDMVQRGGGVVINTASVQGLQSAKGVSAYAATKGAVLSLTRQLALEYGADNVRVLAVNPGTIDTPLLQDALDGMEDEAKVREEMAALYPGGRIGQPREIAEVVLFLASSKASFMTGENVCVDGGIMAKGCWDS